MRRPLVCLLLSTAFFFLARVAAAEPYGLTSAKSEQPAARIVYNWVAIQRKMKDESFLLERCRGEGASCTAAAKELLRLIAEVRAQPTTLLKISTAQQVVNRAISFATDAEQWGELERWSSAVETFSTRRGDCEDYVIAKFFILWQAGVPANLLRLVILQYGGDMQAHAVLSAHDGERWLTLDHGGAMRSEFPRPLYALAAYSINSPAAVASTGSGAR